ncbi:YdgA family protein [Chitinimonas koreensis]|uniref:YdgA family protein n=1 Tax=Chitinimonas koreensis TaxID=356302 RepID=UPI0003F65552|nr:YdgA family protein [Chitinimonas koreensis]QNM96063.1 YdgA family protein [Chitinimonas koreensis]
MNQKQKLPILIGAAVGALAIAYTGASWWAGKQAEITLAKQHRLIADLPYFVVKSRDYQRGVFSSHERTTIALNPTLAAPYLEMLKLAGEDAPKLELSYTQTVRHGPLPLLLSGNPTPLKAAVTTDVEFNADTQAVLKKIFGEQKPLQIENRIRFDDDGVFSVKVPAFTYEETLAKVKAVWQGLDATLAYGGDFNKVDIAAVAPGLTFQAGPKGSLEVKDLRFEAHNARGRAGIMLGEGKLSLASAHFTQTEGRNIDARLEALSYLVKTAEQGEFIDSSGDVAAKTLVLNGKSYGPAKLSVAATHLHGPTLAKLSKIVSKIQREIPDPRQQAAAMFDAFRKDGKPLLRNDPALAIKELTVKLPEGEVSVKADLALKGFEDQDLDMPIKLLEKLDANADIKLPKQVIETYVLWQARGMIAIDTEDGDHPDASELDNLARNLMESQIRKLADQNLIRIDGEMLSATAKWQKGRLSVNGKAIPLPWQATAPAEAEAGDEDEDAAAVQ